MATLILHCHPQGDDRARGDSAQPLATPQGARDAVRAWRAAGGAGAVRIVLAAGTYELTAPLDLLPEDSGTAESPVTWCSADGGQALLSGGRRLRGWTVGVHAGCRAWTMELPEVRAGAWNFTQLWVGGVRRPRTRLPRWRGLADGVQRFAADAPFLRFAAPPEGWVPEPGVAWLPPAAIDPAWRNRDDIEIVGLRYWIDRHLRIAEWDPTSGRLQTPSAEQLDLVDENGQGARCWIENVGEALDTPGQWYLDRVAGRLTYLPLPHEQPDEVEVIAPRLPWLLRLLGATDHPSAERVRHVYFERLAFAHAEWRLPPVNVGSAQAQFHLPGALWLRGAEDCSLFDCAIAHVSQYAIEVQRGSVRNRIVCCRFTDLGAGAVKINHDGDHVRADTTGSGAFAGMDGLAANWRGSGVRDGARCEIADCVIRGVGRVYPCNAAILVGDSAFNRVVHNRIDDTYYSAISVGWVWGYHRSLACGNRIEGNRITRIGQGLLSDMGAIYLLGVAPGTTVRDNWIDGVTAHGYGGGGIYPDEGSSHLDISGNVVLNAQGGALTLHYGRSNRVRGNLFAGSRELLLGHTRSEPHLALRIERNLLVRGAGRFLNEVAAKRDAFADNVFWSPAGGLSDLPADGGALVVDPLVGDLAAGDVSLGSGSPALRLGIGPFVAIHAGPRHSPQQRPSTIADIPPWPAPATGLADLRLELGMTAAELAAEFFRCEPNVVAADRTRWIDSSRPVPVALVMRNAGDAPLCGRVALTTEPHEGSLDGPLMLDYALAPGAWAMLDATCTIAPGCAIQIIRAQVEGPAGAFAAATLVSRPRASIRRLPTMPLAAVRTALAADHAFLAAQSATHGADCASLRLALVGDALAVWARLRDPQWRRGGQPWDGSGFELFTAMPGTNGRAGPLPGRGNQQLFLLPAADQRPAEALSFAAGIAAEPQVLMNVVRDGDWWEVVALVPLAVARLDHAVTRFACEAQFSMRETPDAPWTKRPIWTSAAGSDNSPWGLIDIV